MTTAAEVGLLSRNIKIIGGTYDKLLKQAFGARVLVGKYNYEGQDYSGKTYLILQIMEFHVIYHFYFTPILACNFKGSLVLTCIMFSFSK